MAIDTNTDLLLANQYYTMAGPCTEMNLMEIAAQAMCDTVSGRELLSGVASAKGVKTDHISGLEARMLGDCSTATCGMEASEVNQIVERILSEYERSYSDVPEGKTFRECYKVDDVEPTDEYLEIYEDVLSRLNELGIGF